MVHEGQKDHQCEFCEKAFSAAGGLKMHIKSIHDGHKDQQCDICSKSFSTKSQLTNHNKNGHNKKINET